MEEHRKPLESLLLLKAETALYNSDKPQSTPGESLLTHGQGLPQVGTSSSADDVCSSVDGFFFPRPMILVIFFPVTLDTVPLASDLEGFFLFAVNTKT